MPKRAVTRNKCSSIFPLSATITHRSVCYFPRCADPKVLIANEAAESLDMTTQERPVGDPDHFVACHVATAEHAYNGGAGGSIQEVSVQQNGAAGA